MERHRGDWSELCPEILSQIAGLLHIRQDLHSFRSVCKKWRCSFPLSIQTLKTLPLLHPFLPWEILPACSSSLDRRIWDLFFSLLSRGGPLYLVANAVYLLRPRADHDSSQSWLVTVEEFDRGKLRLRFPLTRIVVKDFPDNFPRALNLSNFHVSLVASGYNIRFSERESLEQDSILNRRKVVLFSNRGLLAPLTVDDCILIVLFCQGSLAWARLGSGKDQWGYVRCGNASRFDDIVELKGCIYAIDRTGRVFVIHYDSISNLRVECVADDLIFSGCDSDRQKRLAVDTSGVLYLVYRDVYCGEKIHFKVYRLDEERCKWDEVNSLGEKRVLFVGVDWCFFAAAADFLGCRENCIIFCKNSFPKYDNRVSDDDSCFEGASEELGVGVFHLEDGDTGLVSAYPGISDILWPPPVWLSPNSSSSAG